MKNKIIILPILLSTFWFSCEKELNITDFKDDFGNYESELKIEGLLQQDKPKDSIIRIIKTSAVTDTDIFNGKDDDGDYDIDEYDEILPQIQDTSAMVKVRNLDTEEIWEFQYVVEADSFFYNNEDEHGSGNDTDDSDNYSEVIKYGGYKPVDSDFHLENFNTYQLEVYSKDFNKTIIGETMVYPAPEFIDTLFNFQDSIVTMKIDDEKEIFWKSDQHVTAYYITYEEIYETGPEEYATDLLFSYKSTIDHNATEKYSNVSVGRENIWSVNSVTILRITVEGLSPAYGRYMFSSLPLNDPEKSNLSDENGNPVMGCFGATAAKSIYIIIEE